VAVLATPIALLFTDPEGNRIELWDAEQNEKPINRKSQKDCWISILAVIYL